MLKRTSPGFADYVLELLAGVGPIRIKRMFGGAGVFLDDRMFALIDDDVLFLKADAALAADLRAMGSAEWTFIRKSDGVARPMGYWRLPESAADDPELAAELGQRAFAVAHAKRPARRLKRGC